MSHCTPDLDHQHTWSQRAFSCLYLFRTVNIDRWNNVQRDMWIWSLLWLPSSYKARSQYLNMCGAFVHLDGGRRRSREDYPISTLSLVPDVYIFFSPVVNLGPQVAIREPILPQQPQWQDDLQPVVVSYLWYHAPEIYLKYIFFRSAKWRVVLEKDLAFDVSYITQCLGLFEPIQMGETVGVYK